MTIIKPGNEMRINTEYRFVCAKCGCIFTEKKSNCQYLKEEMRNDDIFKTACPYCSTTCYSSLKEEIFRDDQ